MDTARVEPLGLPDKVVNKIIDHLSEDDMMLKECRLVCRSWRDACDGLPPCVLRIIALEDFVAFQSKSQDVWYRRHMFRIRRLELCPFDSSEADRQWIQQFLLELGSTLPNTDTLSITSWTVHDMPSSVLLTGVPQFRCVKSLTLGSCAFEILGEFQGLVGGLPRLQELSLRNVTIKSNGSSQAALLNIAPPELSALSVSDTRPLEAIDTSAVGCLAVWLAQHPQRLRYLYSLTLSVSPSSSPQNQARGIEDINKLVQVVSQQIRQCHLQFTWPTDSPALLWNETGAHTPMYLGLDHCTSLKKITLKTNSNFVRELSMFSPKCEIWEVHLLNWGTTAGSRDMWADLAEQLQGETFDALRTVMSTRTPWDASERVRIAEFARIMAERGVQYVERENGHGKIRR